MFDKLIGQPKVKSRLTFFANAKKSRGRIPPLLFNGAKGLGKTEFAKEFAYGLERRLMEINCATIRNDEQFMEQIFVPYIHDKPKLADLFLTAFNTDNKKRKSVTYGDYLLEFDFERQTYLFATTDMQKLSRPFKDRMTEINFAPYSPEELGEIVKLRLDWVDFRDEVIKDISMTLRGNARSAVKRAMEIEMFCDTYNHSHFGREEWETLCDTLEILPFGLTPLEKQVLLILKERGACTLQTLSAVTGMEGSAIQQEVELHLLREGFMRIDGKREITGKGHKVLDRAI